jgi:separase
MKARLLFLQSMQHMNADPVYSVLQESTLSFPSVVGPSRPESASGDKISASRLRPPRKQSVTQKGLDPLGSKSPRPSGLFEKLCQAQDHLTEIFPIALLVSPVAVIRAISALLNSVSILLSAGGYVKGKLLSHPGLASRTIGNFLC